MNSNLENIIKKEELLQSDLFNDLYNSYLESELNEEFQSVYFSDHINNLHKSIFIQFKGKLTDLQKKSLYLVFQEFDKIQKLIDPERLKEFKYCTSNENELLLYRKTNVGLSNLIIDEDGEVAFSFIPFDSSKQSRLEYFHEDNLEQPALLLFVH